MALTPDGLEIRRLPEVTEDIVESEQSLIDPNINTDDDTLLGQLNQIIAAAIADQEALAQAVNDNFNPLKAEGKNLDDLAAIIGIKRIAATRSNTDEQLFVGDEGSVLFSGSLILENPTTQDRFITTSEVTLSISDCRYGSVSVQTVLNNTTYTVVVNSTQYDYLSDGDATEQEILDGLKGLIDADGAATWTADSSNNVLTITTNDAFNIGISGLVNMLPDKAAVFGNAQAQVVGDIVAPANSVTTIIVGAGGLDSTTNSSSYVRGRLEETDEELRARLLDSQQIAGSATVPSIEDSLRNVTGVTSARVFENRSFVTDGDGRPPKSFESIVIGGDDSAVAQQIYDSKPAGIETYGITNSETVLDSLGNQAEDSDGTPLLINFTRPQPVHLAFEVEFTKYDEESFPTGGEAGIATALETWANAQGVDTDIIPSRSFGAIYVAVSGIDSLVVKVQEIANPGDPIVPGNWQTTRLPITFREFGSTTTNDITVIEV